MKNVIFENLFLQMNSSFIVNIDNINAGEGTGFIHLIISTGSHEA